MVRITSLAHSTTRSRPNPHRRRNLQGAQETEDRNTIAWSGLQIDAIEMLATYGKPVVLAHMGEQCDDSVLLTNPNVSSIV